jgi:hypothetical protein
MLNIAGGSVTCASTEAGYQRAAVVVLAQQWEATGAGFVQELSCS